MHNHHHNYSEIENKFKYAIILTSIILVLEVAGGIWTNSLALLSDAGHLFMDVFSLSLSWAAYKISFKPATGTKTYGYHRLEIFAAFINGITLVIIAFLIFKESWYRILNPREIEASGMIWIALVGFLVNCITIMIIKKAHSKDVNLKSAFYHVLSDTLASVGVIIGGIIIYFTGWFFVDPILSILIGIIITVTSFSIISETFHVFLEGVPKSISVEEVANTIQEINGVEDIHELHIWSICSNVFALSTHILINDQLVSDGRGILKQVNAVLKDKFNITHTTIQFETSQCGCTDLVCNITH